MYFDSKPYCVLINRNLDIFLVDIDIHKDAFDGTVLDGELVKDFDDKWRFYIFDGVMINGASICKLNHDERIQQVEYFLQNRVRECRLLNSN